MEYRIEKKSAFRLVEKVETHTTQNAKNIRSIPDFWNRANQDGTVETLENLANDHTWVLGVCYENSVQEDGSFDYSIAAISDKPAPSGYREMLIPARTWAIFTCKGKASEAVSATWRKIYQEVLPNWDYLVLKEVEIEAYPDGDTESQNYVCQLWLPVVEK